MEKYVITISRQYGSFGRLVAKKLSEQLHIDFLDRDIVEETAKRMNTSVKQISREEVPSPRPLSAPGPDGAALLSSE